MSRSTSFVDIVPFRLQRFSSKRRACRSERAFFFLSELSFSLESF
jgi:hypothetical protein